MTETAGIGHNSRAYFDDRLAEFLKGLDVWGDRPALDADTAPRARDFIAGAKKLLKETDEARKADKEPHMTAAKAVDEAWRPTLTAIESVIAKVEPKLTAWLREEKRKADEARAEAERQRVAAEKAALAAAEDAARATTDSARIGAERRQQEAEAATARAAKAAKSEPTRVESATGLARRAGLRTVRKARIVSVALALTHYRGNAEVLALIERLANADIRAAKGAAITIPGVEIDETEELAG